MVRYSVRYTPGTAAEVENAIRWYDQPNELWTVGSRIAATAQPFIIFDTKSDWDEFRKAMPPFLVAVESDQTSSRGPAERSRASLRERGPTFARGLRQAS